MSKKPNSDNDDMQLLKRALLKIEQLESKVDAADSTCHAPIAVIGIGCRLPGGIAGPEQFWESLRDGADLVSETPADRWDADAFYDPSPGTPGKMYSRAGAFLDSIDEFDPQFFGIAPREAISLDPQQRLLLEVSWEALENAGLSPQQLAGKATGVFFGIGATDYQQLQMHQQDLRLLDAYHASGMAHSVAAGRVSYVLGLTGPSIAIDTACSSSLTAIHYACQSLRNGECRSALAGGVNVMLAPFSNIAFSQSSMLSQAGRCATFDAAADGFVQGEGCGVIVMKRLQDALEDGDRIEAVIRGSAINQDGASSGLTAPNGPAQEAVIRMALANAGIAENDVSYVEAHGSGTPLGDPIEVQALAAALGKQRSNDEPLIIGSVKTNVGHLATAAGITGVIKVILAMRAKQIPAHLNFATPNPYIPWARLPISVATKLTPWRPSNGRRIAGVSGFGFSGTNVHIVIEEPVHVANVTPDHIAVPDVPLPLSAKSAAALRKLASSFAVDLATRSVAELPDVLYTASTGRAHFKHRLVVYGATPGALSDALAEFSADNPASAARSAALRSADGPRVAFLFSGTGSEYEGMGRQLFETEPVFRNAIERCAEIATLPSGVSLASIMYPDSTAIEPDADLGDQRVAYPALFAVEYALASLWRSWGVDPWVVMGHGIGEYVAVCVAGALSIEDAIGLVVERGRLMHRVAADGVMVALFGDVAKIRTAVEPLRKKVSIAAINGPRHVVVSGVRPDVQRLCDKLLKHDIRSVQLDATQSLQSPLIDPILDELEVAAQRITVGQPGIGIVSGVSGDTVSARQLRQPSYWRAQARETIQFAAAVNTLQERDVDIFVEIGPDAVLAGLGAQVESAPGAKWIPSMRRGEDIRQNIFDALGNLYLNGADIDWHGVFGDRPLRKIVLPGYPFERERYWIDDLTIRADRGSGATTADHPLLGTRIDSPLDAILFQSKFDRDQTPALFDHVVHGVVIVPAAAIIEMAVAAGRSYFDSDEFDLIDVSITEALTLRDEVQTEVQLVLKPNSNNRVAFQLFSRPVPGLSNDWRAHAAGVLVSTHGAQADTRLSTEDMAAVAARCTTQVDVELLYSGMWERGLQFGTAFRGLRRLSHGDGEALGEVGAGGNATRGPYRFDPAVLDACIQVVSAALPDFDVNDTQSDIFMPIAIDRVRMAPLKSSPATSHARLHKESPRSGHTLSADLRICDASGMTLIEIEGLHLKRADAGALRRATTGNIENLLYKVDWAPVGAATRINERSTFDLPEPREVGNRAGASFAALFDTHGVDIYEGLSTDLDALCASYVADALRQLGWSFEFGQVVTVDVLRQQLGIKQRHRQLLERLLNILCEEDVLSCSGNTWTVRKDPSFERSAEMVARLLQKYTSCDAELRWTKSCGDKLAAALCGDADPHNLLFPGGDMSLATTVYSKTPIAKLFNGLLAEAIEAIVARQTEDQRLNVLEIGAGTGASTEVILKALPADRAQYTFSDIGPAFVNHARRRFSDHGNAEFKVLDIERDPEPQGFCAGQYNVIVASNVLHATTDLRATLQRVEKLLVPGGLLILLEVVAPQRWFDMTVGLTPGWWQFADKDLRPDHPLLASADWNKLLQECGFNAAAVVPEEHTVIEQAMIIAKKSLAVDAFEEEQSSAPVEDWYILADDSGVGALLAKQLEKHGKHHVLIRKSSEYRQEDVNSVCINPKEPEHFARLVREFVPPSSHTQKFVYLWALDQESNLDQPDLSLCDEQATICGGALHLVQALGAATLQDARLVVVTRGAQAVDRSSGPVVPQQATLWGLKKAISLEHPELRTLIIDLDPSTARSDEEARTLIDEVRYREGEDEIALRMGGCYGSRLVHDRNERAGRVATLDATLKLEMIKPASGLLEDLQLQSAERRTPDAGQVEIRVRATGLNFRDVLVALDVHHDFDSIGSECAGHVIATGVGVTDLKVGDDVIAIAPCSLATHVVANAALTVKKPRWLTFADAVTLPIAFLTADFALNRAGRMNSGDVVLIHSAAGGVGMAAVQLARLAGATVLATAGSPRKRRYLRQLGIEHVMNSRTLDFAREAMQITKGRGVDIVLNGLTGEFIEKGLEILAPGGRFVELGKSDVWDTRRARVVNANAEYHAIDLTDDMLNAPQSLRPLLEDIMRRLENRELSPLPWQSFRLDDVVEAFRFMEQARHIGKVVVMQDDPDSEHDANFRDDGTYLIIGGLSGLGERVAEWAVEEGARHLVLAGRRDPAPGTLAKIHELEARGARITVVRCDVAEKEDVQKVLDDIAADLPPLRGVFHSAGVLDDALLLQQDWSGFAKVMAPKVSGAWLLHTLVHDLPLDFFVLFSSVAAVLGGSGAGNHSAANAFLDSLAHSRRRMGMPALSIDWGAWSETGAAVRDGARQHVASQGLGFITPSQGLEALGDAMRRQLDCVAVFSIDWPTFFERDPQRQHRPLLAEIVAELRTGSKTSPTRTDEVPADVADFVERLIAVYPNKRLAMIEDHVAACAGSVLGLDSASIDTRQPLSEMGMDSLMAVDIRNTIRVSIGKPLPATLLFDYPTVEALSRYLANDVLAINEPPQTPAEPAEVDLLASIERLSDEEVDRAYGDTLDRS